MAVIIIAFVGYICLVLLWLSASEQYRMLHHRKLDDYKYILTLEKTNSLARLFRKQPAIIEVAGFSTVWYYKDNFRRCGTSMNSMLSSMIARIEFEEKYGEDA